MLSDVGQAYLDAALVAVDLLAVPQVASCWDQPSALADLGVAGLAGHLARQVTQVYKITAEPPATGPPIPLLEHFARSDWNPGVPADAAHAQIRQRAEQSAAAGAPSLLKQSRRALQALQADLPKQADDRVVELQGLWCLTLDDFLTTRLLELVVHADDLAVSVAVPTPPPPENAAVIVVDLLSRLAARRHGALPVIRSLARTERAPASVRAI